MATEYTCECGDPATIRLSATDLDGNLLDSLVACDGCGRTLAGAAGLQIGPPPAMRFSAEKLAKASEREMADIATNLPPADRDRFIEAKFPSADEEYRGSWRERFAHGHAWARMDRELRAAFRRFLCTLKVD